MKNSYRITILHEKRMIQYDLPSKQPQETPHP